MQFEDRYFEVVPGVDLRYWDEGEGRPLVFVPGYSFSIEVFEKQIAYLSKFWRCIAVDPRCHGKSTITHFGNTYDAQGADLVRFIDGLGLKDVVLIGWSFGALATWAYVEQKGLSNVSAVITLDNSPRSLADDPAEYCAGTFDGLLSDNKNAFKSPEALRAFMGGFCDGLLYEGKLDPALRQELIDTACRIPVDVMHLLYADGWLSDKREVYHAIDENVPNLLVIANYRKDVGVPYMKAHYPHTRVEAFGMHMMFHEYPEKTNELIESFLRDHKL